MKSEVGSILTLIGGILTLVISVVVILAGIIVFSLSPLGDKIGGKMPLYVLGWIFVAVFILFVVAGILKIYASRLMKDKKTTLKGGILALILGIVVSDLFSLIGGVVGIVQGNKR